MSSNSSFIQQASVQKVEHKPWTEVVAALSDNLVERPKEIDVYLKGMLNNDKAVQALIYLMVTGWRSMVAESAQKVGHFAVNLASVDHDKSPLSQFLEQKALTKHMDLIGTADNAVKVQVRKTGKDFLVSIPILDTIAVNSNQEYLAANLSPANLSTAGKLFPAQGGPSDPILPHSPSDEQYKQYVDLVRAIIPKDQWSAFFDPSKPVDIHIPYEVGKKNIGFHPEKEDWIPQGALVQIQKWVKGFHLVGPAVEANFDWIEDPMERVAKVAMSRVLHVFGDFLVPSEFAQFFTQSKQPKASDLFVWAMAWQKHWVGSSSPYHVSAVRPLSSIKEENKEQPGSKANSDGLMISPEGYVYYVPTIDQVEQYEEQFHDFVNHDGVFTLAHVGGEKPKKLLPSNKVVYTDWKNNKLAYSDSIGMLQVLDLDGWQPVNATQARNLLDLPLLQLQSRTKIKHLVGVVSYTMLHSGGERHGLDPETQNVLRLLGIPPYALAKDVESGAVTAFVTKFSHQAAQVAEQLKTSPNYLPSGGAEYYEQFGPGLNDLGLHSLIDFPAFKWIADVLVKVYRTVHEGKDEETHVKFIEQRSPINGMEELGLLISLVRYAGNNNYQKVVRQDKERRAKYTDAARPGYEWEPKAVTYTAEDRALLPHQVRIDGIFTENKPEWTILACDAGGGKTNMALRYISQLLTDGEIKRPLIAMPGFLIKNYIEENVYFFDGKFNMVVLNSNTMMVYTEEGLSEMIRKAPPNTIYLSDFSFLSNHNRNREIYYGAGSITINLNVEFLQSCGIDFFGVDESHGLRNDKADKTIAARKLALGIKHKMLMTGTFINNNLSDTAGQFALLDPSVFGNKSDFRDEHGDIVHGQKVISWKKDAEAAIKRKIAGQCMFIEAKRKEWGAALPHLVENLFVIEEHQVDPAWYSAYKALLESTLEEIRKNKALAAQMEEDDLDESDLAAALNPYLQRLEAFMIAPNADPFASKLLKGEQLIGPKVRAVIDIAEEHLAKPGAGKILVFVNQHVEADSVYENLPASLKKRFIRYHAENKDRDIAKFKRDPNIIGLVGVEDSLGTGLNLQVANLLIRLNGRWNPGDLEQANARIWRPNPKEPESARAKEVTVETVLVDLTIDVTKFARLTSKILSKAKFDEAGNPKYDQLESLPIIKMNLDTISTLNSVEKHLAAYIEEYSTFKAIYTQDLNEWKERFKDTFKMKPLPPGKDLEGGKMMRTIPYVPEMYLPHTEKLGLVRYSDYVDAHAPPMMEDPMRNYNPVGKWVHTEFGDGEVQDSTDHRVKVKLVDGTVIKGLRKLKTFVLPGGKPAKPIKQLLAQNIGLELTHKDTQVTPEKFLSKRAGKPEKEDLVPKRKLLEPVKPTPEQRRGKQKEEEPTEQAHLITLNVESVYDQLAITVPLDGLDEEAKEVLEELGYRDSGPYMFARFNNKQQLNKWVAAIEEEFDVHPRFMRRLQKAQRFFNQGPRKAFNASSAMSAINMTNFWRMKSNKAGKNEVRPYSAVLDGEFHVVMALTGMQPANKLVPRKIRIPGIVWHPTDGEMIRFFPNKAALVEGVKKLIANGIKPNDMAEVKQSIKDVRVHAPD